MRMSSKQVNNEVREVAARRANRQQQRILVQVCARKVEMLQTMAIAVICRFRLSPSFSTFTCELSGQICFEQRVFETFSGLSTIFCITFWKFQIVGLFSSIRSSTR